MEIAPPGTPDPTSGLYNSTMLLMAALLAIALVSNALMRPVDPKHHLNEWVNRLICLKGPKFHHLLEISLTGALKKQFHRLVLRQICLLTQASIQELCQSRFSPLPTHGRHLVCNFTPYKKQFLYPSFHPPQDKSLWTSQLLDQRSAELIIRFHVKSSNKTIAFSLGSCLCKTKRIKLSGQFA